MTSSTILLRQIHPNFLEEGIHSSQAFIPKTTDKGQLSVYDGDQIIPSQAYAHYTDTLNLASGGVWAVTKEEADQVGTIAEPDPLPDFEAHSILNFNNLPESSNRAWRKAAKKLKGFALEKGCLHEAS